MRTSMEDDSDNPMVKDHWNYGKLNGKRSQKKTLYGVELDEAMQTPQLNPISEIIEPRAKRKGLGY